MNAKLKTGDIVEVLQPSEILKTLDSLGTLDNLPFMPEMINSCGKKYKVKSKITKTCVSCLNPNNSTKTKIKEFIFNDVVTLEDLRCSGASHNDCQLGCLIFWKEAWLKRADNKYENTTINQNDVIELGEKLVVKESNKKFFCQSTQLHLATRNVLMVKRFTKLVEEVLTGGIKFYKALKSIVYPVLRKLRYDRSIKGSLKTTPLGVLNLQPGEFVETKSFNEILETLDKSGKNKGLRFFHDMKKHCGKRFRVRNRLERMINEATGEMMEIKNTVILDEVTCSYEYGFMGCPRSNFQFWREIWLKRINNN